MNNNYLTKSLKPAIIIFIISVIIISVIYIIMNTVISNNKQQDTLKRRSSATRTNQPNSPNSTSKTHKGSLTANDIKDDLLSNQDIYISQRENIDKWTIIVIKSVNNSTDPALLVYYHIDNTYKRILGPGTLFTRQNLTNQNIPDKVIDKSLVIKKFLSSQAETL